ncbi:MAG: Nif3-like dinuclear metal center hexameric protein [Bacteroidota bacterium]|nr:Nif3-like dinuclear metal center hexameric protein [Bacteroidota bacterium]
MKLHILQQVLESFAPRAYQESYDNSGIQLGEPDTEIYGALVTLDVTEEIVEEAIQKKCNLIVSHHPVLFHSLNSITGKNPVERIILKAIRFNIAIYSIHTSLDNYRYGLNAFVAQKLGLTGVSLLMPKTGTLSKLVTFCPLDHAGKVRQAMFEAGAGHIGNYDCCSYNSDGKGTFRALENTHPYVGKLNELHFENETRIEVIFPSYLTPVIVDALLKNHPYEEVAYDVYSLSNQDPLSGSGITGRLENPEEEKEFLTRIKEIFGIPVLRHSSLTGKPVQKVSICTGAGGFLLQKAMEINSDAFLTSDLRYHDFFIPDGKLLLVDTGHYESEHFVKELISSMLIEKFSTFAILISEINTNPVNYYI